MNTLDFVKRFIFENPVEEISCPVNKNKCTVFVQPTTVIVRNKDIFILGDNRKEETSKNKVILIKNINLENNTFDLSYMECIPSEIFYIYLFTNNLNPLSYSYGLTISLSETGKNLTGSLFNDYNILQGYSHPPILTLDNGNLAFKLKETSSNNIKYIHHIIDFNLIVETKIKFEKRATIDANKELYNKYFSNQIKSYQEYYKEYLKKIAAEQKQEETQQIESPTFLQKYKYYLLAGCITISIIILSIIIYIIKRKDTGKGKGKGKSKGKKSKGKKKSKATSSEE
jgi:hypothetical protein